jgi:hypothetical protein
MTRNEEEGGGARIELSKFSNRAAISDDGRTPARWETPLDPLLSSQERARRTETMLLISSIEGVEEGKRERPPRRPDRDASAIRVWFNRASKECETDVLERRGFKNIIRFLLSLVPRRG